MSRRVDVIDTVRNAYAQADHLRLAGDSANADAYKRVGAMLEGLVVNVRTPLLQAFWNRSESGPTRIESPNELNRRETAAAAAYLLMKFGKQKTRAACQKVADATGVSFETLRSQFKGKALSDYQSSKAGLHLRVDRGGDGPSQEDIEGVPRLARRLRGLDMRGHNLLRRTSIRK